MFVQQERKAKESLLRVKEGFSSWRFNMLFLTLVYIVFFFSANSLIIDKLVRPRASSWIQKNEDLTTFLVSLVLGICFIADSIVTSYLKTPLQRLAIKIESSQLEEEKKGKLIRSAQETNELFKETFKKFGILVIPATLSSIINEPEKIANKSTRKRSESPLFYVCYVVPILFAMLRIWQIDRKIRREIEKNTRWKGSTSY